MKLTNQKDYYLQFKIRNAPLLKAMRFMGFNTAAQLGRASNVAQSIIGRYLNLKLSPIHKRTGKWHLPILKIAKALDAEPFDLFPPQHIKTPLKKNSGEISFSLKDFAFFLDRKYEDSPETLMIMEENKDTLIKFLEKLTTRQMLAVRMRYGFEGKDKATYKEIGDALNVTLERARQIEKVGVRRLRWYIRNERVDFQA